MQHFFDHFLSRYDLSTPYAIYLLKRKIYHLSIVGGGNGESQCKPERKKPLRLTKSTVL